MDGCRAYLQAHSRLGDGHRMRLPVVTISREAGAGALSVAEELATLLNEQKTEKGPPWTIFDKNLVERALEEHDLPGQLKRFMPEDVAPYMSDTVEELLGLHPSSWTLVQHTTQTVLRLASLGHAILIGRAANIIAAQVPTAVHVRLVAPLDARARYLSKVAGFSHAESLDYIHTHDRARRRYVQRYFDAAIDDPLNYTMVLNTGRLSFKAAAHLIAQAVAALPKEHAGPQPA